MKKIAQTRSEAAGQRRPVAGMTVEAPPEMAAQRRRATLMDNSPRTVQLRELAQRMRDGPVVQLGPRKYADKFKPQKNEMMEWLNDTGVIGIDIGEDAEVAGSANEKVGWHHQYPYSELYGKEGASKLADHGANLKLGPMKNRLGDPGNDIDVSYEKASRKSETSGADDIRAEYSPYSKKLIAELLKSNRQDDRGRLLEKVKLPSADGQNNEVFGANVDKEAYWSEWYLSKNIRAVLLSDDKVGQAITGLGKPLITAARSSIVARLNALLNSMQYSYATHTPAQIDGTLGDFQNEVEVETGVPSSKLNSKGPLAEKLVDSEDVTYASLLHNLLVNQKWIARGSQGDAHSAVEQYKDKMKSDNGDLIWALLQEVDLPHLAMAVEKQYKKSVLRCLLALDDPQLPEFFYTNIRELQLQQQKGELSQTDVEAIIQRLGERGPLEKTNYNDEDAAPLVTAASFVPELDENQWSEIANTYLLFTGNAKDRRNAANGVERIATNILSDHGLNRGDDEEDNKGFLFDWQGNIVMTAGDIKAALDTLLEGKSIRKQELVLDETDSFAASIHKALSTKGGETLFRQDARVVKTASTEKTVEPEKIYQHFKANYKRSGTIYINHREAIKDPAKRMAYCAGIEAALRMPGKGYASPALKYPTPEPIKQLGVGQSWDAGTAQVEEFRQTWYDDEFRDFLRNYMTEAEVQEQLLQHVPSA